MQTYTVKFGDSLSKIALQFYGDYTLYNLIAKANNISNINLIHPGDVLTIPDKPQSNESASAPTHSPDQKKSNVVFWWVGGSVMLVGIAIVVARQKKKRKK